MASPTADVLERARALRGEGDLMSLSHIGPVNKFGVRQSESAQERLDAADIPESLMNIGKGVMFDPNDRSAFVPDQYQGMVDADRQHGIDVANIQNRPSSSQGTKMAEWDAALNSGYQLMDSLGGTDAVDPMTDVAVTMGRAVGGNTAGNLIDGWLRSPEGQSSRAGFNRFMARLRKSELGSALTGYEIDSSEQWSPVAAGISKAESKRRMQAIMQDVTIQRDALEQRSGAGPVSNSSAPSNAGGGPAVTSPAPTQTKSLGGKNYVKIQGQWYEE